MNWKSKFPHHTQPTTRREMLCRGGAGFGALALSALLGKDARGAGLAPPGKLAGGDWFRSHPGTAKNVIFLFMEGGPSHIDLFDPKPLLNKLAGQPLPDSFDRPVTAMGEEGSPLLACERTWAQHGEGGLWISDWLPETAKMADDLCVIRSCVSDGINHAGGVCQMNTGAIFGGRPSLGSWVSYGLGSENESLPSFVVFKDRDGEPVNGVRNWGAGFMPAVYQGVPFAGGDQPIANLATPEGIEPDRHQGKLEFLRSLNDDHLGGREDFRDLEARIESYELAYRMQAEAPDAVDLSDEPEHVKALYGMEQDDTKNFGRQCLLARRLVERGVRFVQLYHGTGSKWDSHDNLETNHSKLCAAQDKPVAGLLQDLKQRGLLDQTLVIWGGEFGRTPMSEKGDGRDHNPTGFTMWMAGGGVQGGRTIGATDELGLHATEDRLHVHDLHATILHLMGVDHTRLIYRHKGRPERIDLNEGHFYEGITGA